jgi:hypothetical protein
MTSARVRYAAQETAEWFGYALEMALPVLIGVAMIAALLIGMVALMWWLLALMLVLVITEQYIDAREQRSETEQMEESADA